MNKKMKWIIKTALKTREMRIVLFALMKASGIDNHGFVPGDSHATAFHAGQRSIGLMLHDWILQTCPATLEIMREEWKEFVSVKEPKEKELVSEFTEKEGD